MLEPLEDVKLLLFISFRYFCLTFLCMCLCQTMNSAIVGDFPFQRFRPGHKSIIAKKVNTMKFRAFGIQDILESVARVVPLCALLFLGAAPAQRPRRNFDVNA